MGLYFIFMRPALLPEDVRYMATDLQGLQAFAPLLVDWLGKVFLVMGGFMVGAGVLIAYFAWVIMPSRPPLAMLALVLVGSCTLVLTSAVNFALHSDFRWLLAVPPVVWAAALVQYRVHGQRRSQ